MDNEIIELNYFTNAAELKRLLNSYSDSELEVMHLNGGEQLQVTVTESTLSDNSRVRDLNLFPVVQQVAG